MSAPAPGRVRHDGRCAINVQVCVCTADRPRGLARLLGALGRARPGGGATTLGLVVVDNRPCAATAAVLAAHPLPEPWTVHLLDEPTPGIPVARSRALAAALDGGADHIAFLDDDDAPEPDWLMRLLERQAATAADLVFGASRHAHEVDLPPWAQGLRYFAPSRLDEINSYGIPAAASTSNVLIGRKAARTLVEAGPAFRDQFKDAGGEDTDFFIRAVRLGFSFATAPASLVNRHPDADRLRFAGLVRRAMKFGATRYRLKELHRAEHGPAARRWRSARRVTEALAACGPALWRPADLPARLLDAAEEVGELRAAWGRGPVYYRDRRR